MTVAPRSARRTAGRAARRLGAGAALAAVVIGALLIPATATASAFLPADSAVRTVAHASHADTTIGSIQASEYWLDREGIRAAWRTTRGAGVTIAVIDTGVDVSHPDLAGAFVGGTDVSGIGNSTGTKPIGDESEHGTLVASLALGRGTSLGGEGVLGAAPAASLLAISTQVGSGSLDSDDQIAAAVRWATDHGANVINLSLTRNTPDWPTSWDSAFLYAMNHNVVVVAAAGNRGNGTDVVGAPATMPGVLTVAGVDASGTASAQASTQGITIGVSAASEQLVGDLPGNQYATWSGTSGAAPIVSGIAALVRAAHPTLSAAAIISRITSTATPAGSRNLYGFGTVNADAAVNDDLPVVNTNPMGDLQQWVTLYRRGAGDATPTPIATLTGMPAAASRANTGPPLVLLRLVGVPVLIGAVVLAVWVTLLVLWLRAVTRSRRTR